MFTGYCVVFTNIRSGCRWSGAHRIKLLILRLEWVFVLIIFFFNRRSRQGGVKGVYIPTHGWFSTCDHSRWLSPTLEFALVCLASQDSCSAGRPWLLSYRTLSQTLKCMATTHESNDSSVIENKDHRIDAKLVAAFTATTTDQWIWSCTVVEYC